MFGSILRLYGLCILANQDACALIVYGVSDLVMGGGGKFGHTRVKIKVVIAHVLVLRKCYE